MNRSLLAAVALALLLAGCSGIADTGDAGPSETVTPMPVTDAESIDRGIVTETATPTPTPEPPDRPDGGEFADLLDDHARRVANLSYAYRRTIRYAGENRFPDIAVEGYNGRDATVYYRNQTRDGDSNRFWSNGTVRASARTAGDGIEYSARRASGPRRGSGTDVDRLRHLFQYAQPTAIDENESHYRIEAVFVRKNGETILGPDATIENSSLSMAVTTEGLIESYRIEIHGEREDGERIDIVERFSLDPSVDRLPRPAWVDRAIDRARAEQFGNRLDGFGYADEHEAALENESYAYRFETRTDDPNVSVRNETVRGYSGSERGVLLFNRTIEDGETEDVTWSNGTTTVFRNVDGESESYHVEDEAAPFSGRDIDRLRERLEFAELRERRTNGTHELIEATLTEENGLSLFGPDVRVENSTLSLVVAEDGVIEAYDLEATVVDRNGERATVTERFRLDRTADTLSRPGWVDRAIESVARR